MKKSDGLGRRAFLRGVGGAGLALPFLSMMNGTARGQEKRPTRVVFVFHSHGTILDRWKPRTVGALSAALPSLLAPLEPYKAKMNVLGGIDNIVNKMNTATNGHNGAARTLLTCQPFRGVKSGQQPADAPADGPSIDWVLGPKLQAGMPRSVINLGITDSGLGSNTIFWRASNQAASILSNPRDVANTLFTNITTTAPAPTATPPAPTPEELFRRRKNSMIDAVASSYKRLSKNAPAEDRVRLDAHAEQVQALERLTGGGTTTTTAVAASASCGKPSITLPGTYVAGDSSYENVAAAAQIENTVMALACNLAPVVTLQFVAMENPNFSFLFNNDKQAVLRGSTTYNDWHALVHEAGANNDAAGVSNLAKGFTFYMQQVANLWKRLGEVQDGPGQTLADNTIVVSISEFGDGAHHYHEDLPVLVLGDLGGRLKTGQYLDMKGYTTGDLYTTIQTITSGDETKFGMTGTVPSFASGMVGRAFHRGNLPGII